MTKKGLILLPEFSIDAGKFSKMLDFCNRLTGSERNRKVLYFFYKNGLKLYASDGCLMAIFKLSQDVEEFTGSYALSIKTMKLFIEDRIFLLEFSKSALCFDESAGGFYELI